MKSRATKKDAGWREIREDDGAGWERGGRCVLFVCVMPARLAGANGLESSQGAATRVSGLGAG